MSGHTPEAFPGSPCCHLQMMGSPAGTPHQKAVSLATNLNTKVGILSIPPVRIESRPAKYLTTSVYIQEIGWGIDKATPSDYNEVLLSTIVRKPSSSINSFQNLHPGDTNQIRLDDSTERIQENESRKVWEFTHLPALLHQKQHLRQQLWIYYQLKPSHQLMC